VIWGRAVPYLFIAALVVTSCVSAGCQHNPSKPIDHPPTDSLPSDSLASLAPGHITTFAGTGLAGFNGRGKPRLESWLYWPTDVSVRAGGDVYIVDWNNHQIREVIAGTDTLHTVAGGSFINDQNTTFLNHPVSIAFTGDGTLLIAAWHNHQIRERLTALEPSPLWGTTPGFAGDNGPADVAEFNLPSSVVWGMDSTAYISDEHNRRIRAVLPDSPNVARRTIVTFAGTGEEGFSGDGGPALQATFSPFVTANPQPGFRLARSDDGRFLYVCDTYNHRVRRIDLADPAHTIVTIAGSGPTGDGAGSYAGDGGLATDARLNLPTDVDVDADGSLYICDSGNNVIRRVDASGIISTAAGSGRAGFGGDGGLATSAALNQPNGIGLDRPNRRLYIADEFNHRIRVVKLQ
jgi:hypothetical protein